MASRRLFDGAQNEIGLLPIVANESAVSALGVTLTATASFIAGAATGAAVAQGITLTATADFIPGSATGGAAGVTAPGTTLTATASLISGAATGAAIAQGDTLTALASFIAGAAQGDAQPEQPRRRRGSIVYQDKRQKPVEPERIETPQAEEQQPVPEIRPIVPGAPMPVKASIAEIAGLTPAKIAQMKARIVREQEDEDDLEALLMIL